MGPAASRSRIGPAVSDHRVTVEEPTSEKREQRGSNESELGTTAARVVSDAVGRASILGRHYLARPAGPGSLEGHANCQEATPWPVGGSRHSGGDSPYRWWNVRSDVDSGLPRRANCGGGRARSGTGSGCC